MFKRWLFLSVLTFACFLSPGFFYGFYDTNYHFRLEAIFLLAFIPMAMIMPLIRPVWMGVLILVIFAIMELIQFSYMFWFGVPLNVFSLALMMDEVGEIVETAKSAMPWGLYHVSIILLSYSITIFAYLKMQIKKSWIATLLAILLLSILPYKIFFKTSSLNNFMPRNDSVSLYNDLTVFTAYFCLYLPSKNKQDFKEFPKYEIKKQEEVESRNIVLIVGESANANHIGLLGYSRETTPLLSKLALRDPNFVAKKAISSSVLTRVSLPMLFAISYHPENIMHLSMQTTHLFKLAKMAGFKTYYISGQTDAEAKAMAPNYVDVIFTKEHRLLDVEEKGDMVLLEEINKHLKEWSKQGGKNFIVIHQRNAHSPYEKGYRGYPQAGVFPISDVSQEEYRINSYDNAMIFNDYFISKIFEEFEKIKQIPSYIMFIPDHGEAMGELQGKMREYGHAFLSPNVANIPLFASLYNGVDSKYTQWLRDSFYPTHYEVGMLLASLMGYQIVNPGFKNDIFYINGTSISGDAGFIQVKKKKAENQIIFSFQ